MAMRKMLQIVLLLFQFPSLVPSMPSCLNHSIAKPRRRFSSTHCLSASMALQFMRAFRGSIVENVSAIGGIKVKTTSSSHSATSSQAELRMELVRHSGAVAVRHSHSVPSTKALGMD
ncbi:hypothetical protein HDK77DRAFT_28519 [Phyllosticta capitalensis]